MVAADAEHDGVGGVDPGAELCRRDADGAGVSLDGGHAVDLDDASGGGVGFGDDEAFLAWSEVVGVEDLEGVVGLDDGEDAAAGRGVAVECDMGLEESEVIAGRAPDEGDAAERGGDAGGEPFLVHGEAVGDQGGEAASVAQTELTLGQQHVDGGLQRGGIGQVGDGQRGGVEPEPG
jgi:hypothetical protein